MQVRVDPRQLAAAGVEFARLRAEAEDDAVRVALLVRACAERLGAQHAGPALSSAWAQAGRALEAVSDGYGEFGRALSELASAYAELDRRMLPTGGGSR